ncbi:MAG: RluA family pseudouridine synthase [Sulfuricurvum sp.]|uniref:RluA family pseudouridine synthase n=1 Tax=Sulfuricurvum sp. TaxID=2025608 RepID=UPI002604A488|nr:RluA family pseudouridine synthase [Sulfuricurvum sp.]MDD2828418.1 RluA family pseudouridine synthase [Sulfuricurvum sp.]MDD4949423.1 RluA family pseudouridine synthase [Sulfuricurvum sp.]
MPFITKKLYSSTRQMALNFLMEELGLSRSEGQRLIARGRLSQNGIVMDDQFGFIEGECEFICFQPLSRGFKPMFVTNDFVVYDKPSGLSVHPHSRLSPYTLNDEIKHEFGDDANATHRIDQETSGLVLVSRHKKSETVLKKLFSERLISKRYLAMVRGHVKDIIDIQEPLFRHDHPNLLISMVVKVNPKGKPSHTIIKPLRYFPEHDMTLVEASPLTGRTHQIRVHLFHVKHPIIGDPVYGPDEKEVIRFIQKELLPEERLRIGGSTRLLLHAHSLEFEYENKRYNIISNKDFVQECFEAMGKC